jgi:hypothetical protein
MAHVIVEPDVRQTSPLQIERPVQPFAILHTQPDASLSHIFAPIAEPFPAFGAVFARSGALPLLDCLALLRRPFSLGVTVRLARAIGSRTVLLRSAALLTLLIGLPLRLRSAVWFGPLWTLRPIAALWLVAPWRIQLPSRACSARGGVHAGTWSAWAWRMHAARLTSAWTAGAATAFVALS